MFAAQGSSRDLDRLVTLIEYVADAKNRAKELKELQDAKKALEAERKKLAKAHGGAKTLEQADTLLEQARTNASKIVQDAQAEANAILLNANERDVQTKAAVKQHAEHSAAFEREAALKHDQLVSKEIELNRREQRALALEQRNAEERARLKDMKDNLQLRAQRVREVVSEEGV